MRNKKLVRILAIALAVLLAGGVVFSALISALAEEQTEVASARNRCELTMEYLPSAIAAPEAVFFFARVNFCPCTSSTFGGSNVPVRISGPLVSSRVAIGIAVMY